MVGVVCVNREKSVALFKGAYATLYQHISQLKVTVGGFDNVLTLVFLVCAVSPPPFILLKILGVGVHGSPKPQHSAGS